jgi:hypothetical protein
MVMSCILVNHIKLLVIADTRWDQFNVYTSFNILKADTINIILYLSIKVLLKKDPRYLK